MVLYILRGGFILLVAAVTMLYVLPFQADQGTDFDNVLLMTGLALGVAGLIVLVDVAVPGKKLSAISGVFLGLLAGLLAAYALSFVVDLIGLLAVPEGKADHEAFMNLLEGVKVIIGLVTCYVSISLVIQTKDDFRFVIPYVEFAKQVRGQRPTLLDTSVIIDGRVLDVADTNILQGHLIVTKFVLDELQAIADSSDGLRRARGRRGLDILKQLQANPRVDVGIEDSDAAGATVDQKLVSAAQQLQARIMTHDVNLNKIASLRGVEVININDLAKALRPVVLPGERLDVKLIKPGEAANQGVGYLDDGTMVVVENGRAQVGSQAEVTVTSTIQTSAGRMVFGRIAERDDKPQSH